MYTLTLTHTHFLSFLPFLFHVAGVPLGQREEQCSLGPQRRWWCLVWVLPLDVPVTPPAPCLAGEDLPRRAEGGSSAPAPRGDATKEGHLRHLLFDHELYNRTKMTYTSRHKPGSLFCFRKCFLRFRDTFSGAHLVNSALPCTECVEESSVV